MPPMTDFNEMFPPDEEELEEIIAGLKEKMNDAESQLEYDEYKLQLQQREKQLQQLIITNNTL